jgi:hypothetical protein
MPKGTRLGIAGLMVKVQMTHDQDMVGSKPQAMYWMECKQLQ